MTRDEIYDHLAQVYLGKRRKVEHQKKRQLSAWLVINIVIMAVIFLSSFYGLTAFLVQRGASLENNVIFSLHQGPITMEYNFKNAPFSEKTFALTVPRDIDAAKYESLAFSIRGREEGTPGTIKIVIRNKKNEVAVQYIRDVRLGWKEVLIPLASFNGITDWSNGADILFTVEVWNVESKKGVVLIEDVRFSSEKGANGA